MKFKAAILYKKNNPLLIQEISLKDPIGYGQILVKVKYSGICGRQLQEINGDKEKKKVKTRTRVFFYIKKRQ